MGRASITRGGNKTGIKWNKGGALRRNKFYIDTSGLDDLIIRLEGMGGNVEKAVTKALETAGKKIEADTARAVNNEYLPAKGKYSNEDTKKSIIQDPGVEWSGNIAEIGVGFDKTKPGAGGFLITGTPRMAPDYELEKIYVKKAYKTKLTKEMQAAVNECIKDQMEGKNGR